jgi:integrase
VPSEPPRFLERVRRALRQRPVPQAQADAYVGWIEQYIRCHRLRHPRELGPGEVAQFLERLAAEPERQAEARAALTFLYKEFLPRDPVPPPPPSRRQPPGVPPPTRSPFLNRCHEVLRVRHYSLRTEECYVEWIKRFILFHGKRHPETMGASEIEAFLTHLAVEGHVSASTQNQAFHALLFLYQQVLEQELPRIDAVRAKRPERLPVVASQAEIRQVLNGVVGAGGLFRLMAELQYGSGLRLMESCRVRVHDLDLPRRQLLVRAGKGDKDRVVMVPRKLEAALAKVVAWRKQLHAQDLARGLAHVALRVPSGASIPGRPRSSAGSFCSRRGSGRLTRAVDGRAGITFTRGPCKGPWPPRSSRPALRNTSRATPSATASRRIYWKWATTFAPCRPCWVTRMWPPR